MAARAGLKRRFPKRHRAIRVIFSLLIPNMDGSCFGTEARRNLAVRSLRALMVGAAGLLITSALSMALGDARTRSGFFLTKQGLYSLVTLRQKNQESCRHRLTTLPYCRLLTEGGRGNDSLCRRRFSLARS